VKPKSAVTARKNAECRKFEVRAGGGAESLKGRGYIMRLITISYRWLEYRMQ